MTETATPEALVASLTAALDEEEASAEAATPGPWRSHDTHLPNGAGHTATVLSGEGNATDLRAWLPTMSSKPWDKTRNAWNDADFIARNDPARRLREVTAKRDLIAAILAEPHVYIPGDSWYSCSQAVDPGEDDPEYMRPGAGCSDDTRKGKPCDCGRDARVERLLRIMVQAYEGEA